MIIDTMIMVIIMITLC